jgi:co-chaperonin GroES (HSP10)
MIKEYFGGKVFMRDLQPRAKKTNTCAHFLVIESMKITADNKLKKLIVVGDRVLIKPAKQSDKTESGLYLPPGVQEKEKIQSGYVIKVGPGYPLPLPADEDEVWKGKEEQVKYLPLQAQEGDLAIFLQKGAIEVIYESEKYYIVPQASILMLEREEDL